MIKARFALILTFALFSLMPCVHAQTQPLAAPVPPAYGVAQRLENQAQAADGYAQQLEKLKDAQAAFQHDIAHRRTLQAIRKYNEVMGSAMYGKTPYAAEASYHIALIQANLLKDQQTAAQTLFTLHNNFRNVAFPDQANAAALLTQLQTAVNLHNKTTPPGSYLYAVLNFLVNLTGAKSWSYAAAIFMLSLLVKLAMGPLSNKQYKSMREMQKLQPFIKEIQAKYKNDPAAKKDPSIVQRKVMEVYKEHNVSMYGGCLPLLVQLPILYLLYYTIRLYQFQFVKGGFLWIGSGLSHIYPGTIAPNLGQQDIPLLVLYGISMYVTQKMTITPTLDPQQAEQQKMMALMTPFMSTYFFLKWALPSAFVLYYLIFNILSTAQQLYYMKRHSLADPSPGGSGGGGGGKTPDVPFLPTEPTNGVAKTRPTSTRNGNGSNGTRRALPGRDVPLAEAKDGTTTGDKFSRPNGAAPTARGVINPNGKVHPKKKRR